MIVAALLFVGLAALFGISWYMNNNTPVPEGCENLKKDCEGCNITSCAMHPKKEEN